MQTSTVFAADNDARAPRAFSRRFVKVSKVTEKVPYPANRIRIDTFLVFRRLREISDDRDEEGESGARRAPWIFTCTDNRSERFAK